MRWLWRQWRKAEDHEHPTPEEIHPKLGMARILSPGVQMVFSATWQMRTPLRILLRDGQTCSPDNLGEPDFEPWMGIWSVRMSMDSDVRERMEKYSRHSTDIGSQPGREYYNFLVGLRQLIEGPLADDEKIAEVDAYLNSAEWRHFTHVMQGSARVIDRLFPPVWGRIRKVPEATKIELQRAGINTIADIDACTGDYLLSFKGIGPSVVKTIRDDCASYDGDRNYCRDMRYYT